MWDAGENLPPLIKDWDIYRPSLYGTRGGKKKNFKLTMFSSDPDPHFAMESRPLSAHLDYASSSFFPFSPLAFSHDSDLIPFPPQLAAPEAHSQLTPPTADQPVPPMKEAAPPPKKSAAGGGRKRATRKDRHSKIVTAQGPRDRRMRLNLEVAPQFFDIQDMLGYDKASKTVQWLMKEARAAIDKLKASTGAKDRSSKISTEAASASELESEDVSVVSDYQGKPSAATQHVNINDSKVKRVPRQPSKRATCPSSLSKESRAMARARARERTRAKSQITDQQTAARLGDYGSEWNELLSSSSHDLKSSLDVVAEVEEQRSPSINNDARVDELSVCILDYNNTPNLFSEDQWEMNQFASIEAGHAALW